MDELGDFDIVHCYLRLARLGYYDIRLVRTLKCHIPCRNTVDPAASKGRVCEVRLLQIRVLEIGAFKIARSRMMPPYNPPG